jgi:hypothetical protein
MLMNVTNRELLLSLLDSVENLVLENIKLRIILEGLPMEKSPGFSLDGLIQETKLSGEAETLGRRVYEAVRTAIRQQSDPEVALKKLLEQFPKRGGLH